VSAAGTLVTGSDGTNGTFAGTLASDYTTGLLNVTKIGAGNWNLAKDNSASILGTLQINGGIVTLDSTTAKVGFVTTILAEGGTLTLDNSTNVLSNRLGGTTSIQSATADRTFSNRGGVLNYLGGGSAVTEALNTLTNLEGASRWNLTAGTAGTTINIGTVSASSTTNRGTLTLNAGAGQLGGGTAASGRVNVFATTPTLVSGIRPDMIGIDSSGTGFVTHDANGFRLLTSADTGAGFLYFNPLGTYLGTATPLTITATAGTVSNAAAGSNVDVTSALGLHGITTVNSLNLSSGGGLTSIGGGVSTTTSPTTLFNAAGVLNTLTLTSGAILAETGNLGLTGGAVTAGGALLQYHTPGDLTSSAYTLGSGGIVKDGVGTLTLNGRSLNTGATFVNEGTLVLGGGANTLIVTPTAGAVTVADLVVNGGTVKLNGNNQAVRQITNTTANLLPNTAGTIVNDSATAANLYTAQSALTNFAGTLGVNGGTANENNFSVDKAGNFAWNLTGAQYYTGATTIRAGSLVLQDSGAITGGGAINANYATLSLVNSGLSHVAARTGTSAINLNGGTLSITPRLEGETSATIGALTAAAGTSTITFAAQPGIGGSINLAGTTLSQTSANGATLNITSATGQIGRGTAATAGQSPQLTFSTAPTLVSNLIGGWATFNNTEFLTYRSTPSASDAIGVGALGDIGSGFLDYSASTLPAATQPLQNIRLVAAGTVPTVANYTLNSLNVVGAFSVNTTLFTDQLFIATGGLIKSGATSNIGQNADFGRLAAGASGAAAGTYNLYVTTNTSPGVTINSRIVNNGASALTRIVVSGSGTTTLANGTSTLQRPATTAVGTTVLMSDTTNLFVGQSVSGPNIPANTTITAITPGVDITLSNAATLAANNFLTFGSSGVTSTSGTLLSGNAVLQGTVTAAQAAGLYVGQPVYSTIAGIPAGTTVLSVVGTTVTLSANPTAALTAAQIVFGTPGNTYTGGTIVNNGATLTLTPAGPGQVVVPATGGLTINGGTVNFGATNIFGAIGSGAAVTINGAGSLTLPNYAVTSPSTLITNTFGALTLNGNGGAGNPTLQLGTPVANQTSRVVVSGITSVNDNLLQVPTIAGNFTSATQFSTLQFSTANPTITVNAGANPVGLQISAFISQNTGVHTGAITKNGNGGLALTNANNNWTTGLNLDAGTLIIGAASTPTTASTVAVPTVVTAGPLGTGTLRIADATTIQTDNTARTIANAIAFATPSVASAFTFGGTAATHNLTLNGVMDLGTATRTINVTSPQVTATIGGQITSGAGSGLTKTGNGILVLSQVANDYTGATTVNGGMLSLGAAGVIPNASALVVNSGGTLNIAGFAETVASLSSGSTTTGGLITNSGAAATLTIDNTTGSTTFGGVISNGTNALNLAKLGASTQVLTNQNTYTGTTTVTGGILEIGNGGSLRGTSALNLNTGGNFRISRAADNVVSFTNPTTFSAVNFQTTGATLSLANTLTGNNQRFGALTFSAASPGTLDFGSGTTNSLTFASLAGSLNGVTVANWTGSVYALSATTDSLDPTQDRLLFTTNPGFAANTVLNQFSFINDAGTLIGRGLQVAGPLSTFEIVPTADTAAYWSGNFGTSSWKDGNATNTNWWTTDVGTTVATVPGPSTDVFITANTPTNFYATTNLDRNFSINSLTFTGAGTANTAGSIIASGTGTNSLTINGASGITVASGSGANTISANVVLGASQTWTNNSSNLLTVSGSVSETAGGSNENLTVSGSGDTTVSGSVILGTGNVAKQGAGTLTFTAANTYTGATVVSAGTLQIGNGTTGSIDASSAVSTVSGATLAVNLANNTSLTNAIANEGTVNATGANTNTLSGIISGTGTVTQSGTGTTILSNANTYSGATLVSAGTLQIGNGTTGSIDASSAVSTVSGATLAVNLADNTSLTNAIANEGTVNATGANTNTLSGIISGTGAVTQSGTGTTILTNANTYSGTTTASNGQLHFTASQTNTAAINVGEASGSLGTYGAVTNSFTSQNAAVLSAADAVTLGSGSSTVTVGSGGVGILAPGGSLGSGNGTLNINKDLVVNSGSMLQVGISTPTVGTAITFVNGVYTFNSSDYNTAGDLFNPDFGGAGANAANAAAAAAIWNVAPSSSSNHDYINVTSALTLSAGSKVHVLENGTMTYGYGQVFNLLDWGSVTSGLDLGTGFSSGGVFGDFYLPDLNLSGFAWDTSAFATHGILVVVPEPSRAFFILLGLLGLLMRRRRH
jgi:autotransporter-associated beta strand protein